MTSSRAVRPWSVDPGLWREWVLASDPDLSRFRTGLRAALAVALSLPLLALLGLPLPEMVLGAALAMLSTVVVTDSDLRAQRATCALIPLPSAAAFTVGTLSASHRPYGLALFVLTIFIAVFVRRFGPRGTALGMMGFNAFFFAQYLHTEPKKLPQDLLALGLGIGVGFVTRFAVVRDRPERTLQRSLRALPATIGLLLWRLARTVRQGGGWRQQRVRGPLKRLNEGALTLEELLRQGGDERSGLRERVFHLELAAERLVASTRDLLDEPKAMEELRFALASAIDCAGRGIAGEPDGGKECIATLARMEKRYAADLALSLFLSRFRLAMEDLLGAVDLKKVDIAAGASKPRGQPPRAPVPAAVKPAGMHPMTRQAIQAACAGAAAMVAGRWISSDRWFWAVLTAFLVLTSASTRGEIFVRAWNRTLGTLVGIFVGMGLAAAVNGHPRVELAMLVAGVFLAFYSLKTAYSVAVLWITAVLAILYGLLGRYSPEILFVRLEETVAGAAIGVLCAAFILPTKSGGKISAALSTLLGSVAVDFGTKLEPENPASEGQLLENARRLDAQLRDLRAAAEPLTRNVLPMAAAMVQLVHNASTVVFYSRQLATPGLLAAAMSFHGDLFHAAALRVSRNAAALRDAVSGKRAVTILPAGPVLAELRRAVESELGTGTPRNVVLAVHWLRRIDDTLSNMARVLRVPSS